MQIMICLLNDIWCGTPKAGNKIPDFQNPKAFILEGLEKN